MHRRKAAAAAVQITNTEKEVQNTGNKNFTMRISKESSHISIQIRQKYTWWWVGKFIHIAIFFTFQVKSSHLAMAHLKVGTWYTLCDFLDMEK